MGVGDVDVQFATTLTVAGIKTAVEAAITATSTSAAISLTQLNDKTLVIVAIEGA